MASEMPDYTEVQFTIAFVLTYQTVMASLCSHGAAWCATCRHIAWAVTCQAFDEVLDQLPESNAAVRQRRRMRENGR